MKMIMDMSLFQMCSKVNNKIVCEMCKCIANIIGGI